MGVTDSTQNLLKLEFRYNTTGQTDNNGSMREQKITVPTVGANAGFTATQAYMYDNLNRIQSATETISGGQTWKQTFSYDRYGNRRFDAVNTTTLGTCQQQVCNPTITTSNNRFSTGQGYSYDSTGSVTQDADGQRFAYDAEGHQKEFFSASNGSTSTPDATYHYDGDGKRVKKIVGTEVTIFVYDASGQLAAEYSTTIASVETAQVSYLTTDHLGSPRIITDKNGAVTSRKDFAAFGDTVTSSQRVGGTSGNGYDPPNVRQDYTGYEKDAESGLEFAQARYYNNGHGRFTSVDPLTASATIRNPQTFNRYSYVLNSPYKFTDPFGLVPFDTNPNRPLINRGGPHSGGVYFSTMFLNDTYTLPLNVVYDKEQYTEEQAKLAMADTVKDLESTYKKTGVKFQIYYTPGTRDPDEKQPWGGASRIAAGAKNSMINVFLFVADLWSGRSGSSYQPESQQIMLWEGTSSRTLLARNVQDKLSYNALAHEVAHVLLHHSGWQQATNLLSNALYDAEIGLALTSLRSGLYVHPQKQIPVTHNGFGLTTGQLFNLGARKLIMHWHRERSKK